MKTKLLDHEKRKAALDLAKRDYSMRDIAGEIGTCYANIRNIAMGRPKRSRAAMRLDAWLLANGYVKEVPRVQGNAPVRQDDNAPVNCVIYVFVF